MTRPWRELAPETIAGVPGSVGVYEIGDADGVVVDICYAGGRSLFGLRGVLTGALNRFGPGHRFRYEVTTSYLTRYAEVAMDYRADHGDLPDAVTERGAPRGRLSAS
jgi:hypothetical protein